MRRLRLNLCGLPIKADSANGHTVVDVLSIVRIRASADEG